MITVHLGHLDPPDHPSAVVLRQVDDYANVRQAVRQELGRPDADLEVYVMTPLCNEWFWDLEGFPGVAIRHEDPATLLRDRLRLAMLPPELDDPGLIHRLGLLRLPTPPVRVGDAIAWALGGLLNPVWTEERPSYQHLTLLISWWAENSIAPELQPLVTHRLNAWRDQADGLLRDAYSRLQENPQKVVLFLCCWRTLAPYEETVRRRWLEEERWYLSGLQEIADRLGPLPLPVEAEKTLSSKVEAYWNRRLLQLNQEAQNERRANSSWGSIQRSEPCGDRLARCRTSRSQSGRWAAVDDSCA